jgi:predicted ATP-grasp superfamily ATP-dependent carboligase
MVKGRETVLLTGGRAIPTLDLARKFHETGRLVYVADSIPFSVSRASNAVCQYFTLPSPKSDTRKYIAALSNIAQRYSVDLIIPTCEELFYIARNSHVFTGRCQILVDEFAKLDQLHDKFRFIQLADSLGFQTPHTQKANSKEELAHVLRTWEVNGSVVVKPIYSRFGTHVTILKNPRATAPLARLGKPPWVVQQYIDGEPLCSYSVCRDGKRIVHVTYKTPYTTMRPFEYRAGLRGPGVYFISACDDEIDRWVVKFVKYTEFSGQIAFDFVRQPDGAVIPIECNPRLTSGIHLFSDSARICDALTGNSEQDVVALPGYHCMFSPSMWCHALCRLAPWRDLNHVLRDICAAKDVLFSKNDPWPYFYSFWIGLYIIWKSWKLRTPFADVLREVMTNDISWNGDHSD